MTTGRSVIYYVVIVTPRSCKRCNETRRVLYFTVKVILSLERSFKMNSIKQPFPAFLYLMLDGWHILSETSRICVHVRSGITQHFEIFDKQWSERFRNSFLLAISLPTFGYSIWAQILLIVIFTLLQIFFEAYPTCHVIQWAWEIIQDGG